MRDKIINSGGSDVIPCDFQTNRDRNEFVVIILSRILASGLYILTYYT